MDNELRVADKIGELKADLAQARALLERLAGADDAGLHYTTVYRICAYCGAVENRERMVAFRHGAKCPIVEARGWLGE